MRPYPGNVRGPELLSGALQVAGSLSPSREAGGSLAQAFTPGKPCLLTMLRPSYRTERLEAGAGMAGPLPACPELGLTVNQHTPSRLSPRPRSEAAGPTHSAQACPHPAEGQ